MNPHKTIYLHIGLPKTGTTSIQHFLFKNRKLLDKKGLSYPIVKLYDKEIFNEGNEFINFRPIWYNNCNYKYDHDKKIYSGNTKYKKNFKNSFQKYFLELINNSNSKNIVLSEEFFSAPLFRKYLLDVVIDILKFYSFDVKIIIYIRPTIDWICSLWQEDCKWDDGINSLKTKALHKDIKDFFNHIPLIEKLGKENVIIRPFEKAQWKNGSLIEDFLDIFDIELTDEFVVEKSKNVSIGRNFTEISRLIFAMKLDRPYEIVKKIKAIAPAEPSIPSTLTDEDILEITNEYKPALTKLANIYEKESFFINELPSCYGKEREPYNVTITPEQFDILIKATQTNNSIKAFFRNLFINKPINLLKKPIYGTCGKLGIVNPIKRPKFLR